MQASDRPSGLPLLEIDDIDAAYGKSQVLRGARLSIAPGETIGLMGRNGMGKTTLIRCVMGLLPLQAGSIRYEGEPLDGVPTFQRGLRGIAYVPEGRGIFASLRVIENLEIAARPGPDGRSDWTVARVLELFPRLAERRTNRGDQLSGGEQQMLAIGRALVTNPRLIMLDEATEGLAPLIRDEIWRTIRLLKDSGLAVLVVDKTVSAVTEIADRVAVIVKGEIVFDGTPDRLKADPEFMHSALGV
jgi:branched-chain amino acid transport system ATP-binding protein